MGKGTTHTPQCPTLFVTNIPSKFPRPKLKEVFEKEEGFYAFREVRHMVFVDFHETMHATRAMRKHQGLVLGGFPENHSGLVIDYDKDTRSKRNAQFELRLQEELKKQLDNLDWLACKGCKTNAMHLKFPDKKTFADLPRRKTDGSIVIKTNKYAMGAYLDKDGAAAVRRKGGIERQYRLKCRQCGLCLGYTSKPFDQPIRSIFFFDGAVQYIPNGGKVEARGTEASGKSELQARNPDAKVEIVKKEQKEGERELEALKEQVHVN